MLSSIPTSIPSSSATSEPTAPPTSHPVSEPKSESPSPLPSLAPTELQSSLPTCNPTKRVTPLPTLLPTSTVDPTTIPTFHPTVVPTFHPTRSFRPTHGPTEYKLNPKMLSAIANGGFEDDASLVSQSKDGVFGQLPSGWNSFKAIALLGYSGHERLVFQGCGDVFLAIAGASDGYIAQNISSCGGIKIQLTFMGSSFSKNASVFVYVDKSLVLEESQVPFSWTKFTADFLVPSSSYVLKFVVRGSGQLLLDNVDLERESLLWLYSSLLLFFFVAHLI